ncbi:hypothetical protein EV424DRAFT_1427694 [Suillus variegatus]|nr:hypothetical protein EV424DRAFT_1427694 [Suillus variegatus]
MFGCFAVSLPPVFLSLSAPYDIMATASSSSFPCPDSFARPVALVASDQELSGEGHTVVSSCVLRKYFGYYGISRDRLPVGRQFPAGDLLPVSAPSLCHIIEHFSVFTRAQYAEIAHAHSIRVISVDPFACCEARYLSSCSARSFRIRSLCTAHCSPTCDAPSAQASLSRASHW